MRFGWTDRTGQILVLISLVMASTGSGCIPDRPDRASEHGVVAKNGEAGTTPSLFHPGLITTGLNERDASMTPDGSEFYFSIWSGSFGTIVMSRLLDGAWSKPEIVPFSGKHNDLEPFVTPDGQHLYFASARPADPDSTSDDFNIWVADRVGDSWSDPRLVAEPVNSSGNEYYPSLTTDGTIYFTSERAGGVGGEDIWRVSPTASGFGTVEALGEGVNTERDEFNAYVAPDGSYLIFSSWGREDGFGGGDLYVSYADTAGGFGPAINLGSTVNSSSLDYSPYVTPDREQLIFSSRRSEVRPRSTPWSYDELHAALSAPGNGAGDLYRVDASILDSLRLASSD
ncbi:MAG: exo-alpha-sialidase [Rhodothermales bacterium]|nr:exo-alpha-sialidase [Rhodothermales bacterium]